MLTISGSFLLAMLHTLASLSDEAPQLMMCWPSGVTATPKVLYQ